MRSKPRPRPAAFLAASLAVLLAPGVAADAAAQEAAREAVPPRDAPALTVERIHATDELSPESFGGEWRASGDAWTVVEADADGHDELWQVDAASGERERLVAAEELVPAGDSVPMAIEDYAFSPDGGRLLIFTDAQRVWRDATKGRYWVFDLDARELIPVSEEPGWQMFAKFGPEGRRVAFVREHDLHVTDLETGEERALTSSGSKDTINGTTDWVYEEELGLRDAFRWSPDGTRIAYWQLDQSPIRPFYLVDETQLYPELQPVRYPKAGTENSEVRVGVMPLDEGEAATTWLDVGSPEYVARMEWVDDATLAVQTLNRHQSRLEVRLADPAAGGSRTVLAEEDSTWVDLDQPLTWTGDGSRFVWSSRRDGWNHLYLYGRDGELVRQLTDGAWDVTGLLGVDEAGGRVWFEAAHPEPFQRSVGWAPTGGGEPTWVAGPGAGADGGSHSADPSPDFRHFFDTRSTISTPPVTRLKRADGTAVRTLVDNAEMRARLDSLELPEPSFLRVTAADDSTSLNAWMIRPASFDSTRTYPLLLYVYGGPGIQTVMDAWGGTRYLWHQLMATRGFAVASVDNRGTGSRGRDFYKQVYLRLGQLETADQLAAAEQLGARPWIDAERIGVWGWSYGGYMTLLTTLRGEGAIAAGASVAPVTDWKFYDTIYTERYMRTPSENPEGYSRGAPLTYADRLEAELLIVHGTGDDNVHPQHTAVMVDRLEQADEQFGMRLYPGKTHSISGDTTRVNLYGLLTSFFERELGGGS